MWRGEAHIPGSPNPAPDLSPPQPFRGRVLRAGGNLVGEVQDLPRTGPPSETQDPDMSVELRDILLKAAEDVQQGMWCQESYYIGEAEGLWPDLLFEETTPARLGK